MSVDRNIGVGCSEACKYSFSNGNTSKVFMFSSSYFKSVTREKQTSSLYTALLVISYCNFKIIMNTPLYSLKLQNYMAVFY